MGETMKVGLIVYSQTGNTLGVAEKIRDVIQEKGHEVALERVQTEGDTNKGEPLRLVGAPDPNGYDAVVFASPVQAFNLAQGMKLYFRQVPEFETGKICCFVTQHLPKPWLGGNKAIRQMQAFCNKAGKAVAKTGIVNWKNAQREEQIDAVVASICETICGG
jgi:flavodoxin